jgi:hypothetical protein
VISLPPPATLWRRCDALARLDHALAPHADPPTHHIDRRARVFFIQRIEGNLVMIAFARAGVLVVGFDHESPMSPACNGERTWPGVIDGVPRPLRRTLAGFPLGGDVTFCTWRLAGARAWRTGAVKRPRGRDVDGAARLLAMLDGNARRYRRYARVVLGRDVSIAVVERAFAGKAVTLDEPRSPSPRRARAATSKRPKFRVGDRIVDPWDRRAKITAVHFGLASADGIPDPDSWLRGLSIRPKTPRRGVWYSARPSSGGSIVVGERDIRRAPAR